MIQIFKFSLLVLSCNFVSQVVYAQSINEVNNALKAINGSIQLEVRKYEGTNPIEKFFVAQNSPQFTVANWNMQLSAKPVTNHPEAMDVTANFKLTEGTSSSTAVSVSFNFSKWSRDNYVMVPAIVYNGNRYHSIGDGYNPAYTKDMYYNPKVPLTISNNPRLAIEQGKASVVELQTGNAATPAMCFYSPAAQKGFIVLTDQQSKWSNHGMTIAENAAQDSCSFSLSIPAMRKLAPGFGDFHKSGDKAPDWKAGDEVNLKFRIYVFDTKNIPDLLTKFLRVRKEFIGPNQPRNLLPMSKELEMATTICSNSFKTFKAGSYYLPENSNDFQLCWVSGMINTYPMLALNNEKERNRVSAELDFVVNKLQGKSGYFYGGITANGELRPEKMHPDFPAVQAMVRKNSDALLWLIKHFMLLKAQGYSSMIKPEWENAAKNLAAAFSKTWYQHGEFGQYIVPETGEIAVFNSTAGARVPAGLVLASEWFGNGEWLTTAREAANYYYRRDIEKQGLTGGCCADISQDPDSETAFGFLESLVILYEATGDTTWQRKAEIVAALCATWTISYDAVFPASSQIGKLQSKMAGAVWASIQNKHAAPGICTASGDYLFKLYRATGNQLYADLIRDIQHAHAEAVNIPPHHITTNNLVGSSMERIQPSDAEGEESVGNYINTRNSWTETNGMLMSLELPGIYVQTDKGQFYTFDHILVSLLNKKQKSVVLRLTNATAYDATVSIFAETSAEAKNPIPVAAFVHWPTVNIPSGETVKVQVNNRGKIKLLK